LNFRHISENDAYFRAINIHSRSSFGQEAKPERHVLYLLKLKISCIHDKIPKKEIFGHHTALPEGSVLCPYTSLAEK
jgi:hypothetical protein